jgi:hypothetical protein
MPISIDRAYARKDAVGDDEVDECDFQRLF